MNHQPQPKSQSLIFFFPKKFWQQHIVSYISFVKASHLPPSSLLCLHGLDVKSPSSNGCSRLTRRKGPGTLVLSVSKDSWLSAYLCLSAFASIHGPVPNSNSKLSKSYLAALSLIQHMGDKNTHIDILQASPFPTHNPATTHSYKYALDWQSFSPDFGV